MDKFIEITEDDIAEVSPASVKAATDIFALFLKTVKAKLVYPVSSKLPRQFKENLYSALTAALEELDELPYKVEADTISYQEHVVYKAVSKTENFAHPFFRDGILEFRFKEGLTFEELEQFVDISSQTTRSTLIEDDLSTLLWEAGFEHISYELMDDFLDIETFEYGTDALKSGKIPSDKDIKSIFEKEIDLNLTEEDFDLNSEKNRSKGTPAGYRNLEDDVAKFVGQIASYTESEKAEIDKLLDADSEFDHVKYAIDILFEILEIDADNASYNETLDLIVKAGTDFIKQGDFGSVIKIVERAAELEAVLKNIKDPKHEKMTGLIERFSASEKIRVMVDYLNKAKDLDYEEVTHFLKLLPWQAIDSLVWALGELDHYPARRAVCQALEVLSVGHPDMLGKGTDSPRWYVVRNIVSILGKTGDPKAFAFFNKTIRHSDIRVRKETVISAARIKSTEAEGFLIKALNDHDEKIQLLALREIVNMKFILAFDSLGDIISSREFKDRPAEQIREFLAGYAILGDVKAFDLLRNIIQSRSLLPSEKKERLKINAIRALGFLNIPESKKILEKTVESKNKKLADMANRTLGKLRRGE